MPACGASPAGQRAVWGGSAIPSGERRSSSMSDERTVEQEAAAASETGAELSAPQVPTVNGPGPNAGPGASSRRAVPVGTILEQGGDVPTPDESARAIDFGDNLRSLSEGDVITGTVVHI